MNYETLRLLRNILLRTFVVGFIFACILGVLIITGWTTWAIMADKWLHIDEADLAPLITKFFLDIRFFLVFIVLTPAFAIHWTLKKERK